MGRRTTASTSRLKIRRLGRRYRGAGAQESMGDGKDHEVLLRVENGILFPTVSVYGRPDRPALQPALPHPHPIAAAVSTSRRSRVHTKGGDADFSPDLLTPVLTDIDDQRTKGKPCRLVVFSPGIRFGGDGIFSAEDARGAVSPSLPRIGRQENSFTQRSRGTRRAGSRS